MSLGHLESVSPNDPDTDKIMVIESRDQSADYGQGTMGVVCGYINIEIVPVMTPRDLKVSETNKSHDAKLEENKDLQVTQLVSRRSHEGKCE